MQVLCKPMPPPFVSGRKMERKEKELVGRDGMVQTKVLAEVRRVKRNGPGSRQVDMTSGLRKTKRKKACRSSLMLASPSCIQSASQ